MCIRDSYYIDNLMDAPTQLSAQDKLHAQAMFREMDFDPERLAQSAARALSCLLYTSKAHQEASRQAGRHTARRSAKAARQRTQKAAFGQDVYKRQVPPMAKWLGDLKKWMPAASRMSPAFKSRK